MITKKFSIKNLQNQFKKEFVKNIELMETRLEMNKNIKRINMNQTRNKKQ